MFARAFGAAMAACAMILMAAMCLGVPQARAAVTLTESTTVSLYRGASKIQDSGSWDACQARAHELANTAAQNATSGTVTYSCKTEVRKVIAKYSADPIPCPARPADLTRQQTCPSGTTGSWPQTQGWSASAYPECWAAGEWSPAGPPAGACTPVAADTDSDGVPDALDKCPTVAASTPDGCPVVTPPPAGNTIKHGEPFTITGTGFGTKPVAAPLVYDDFENGSGAVPGKAAVVGGWLSSPYCTGISYATFEGKKVAKHAFGNGTYNASLCVDPEPATQTFYLDFWMKAVPKGGPSRNWKAWRTYDASDNENGNTVYYCRGGGIDLGGRWVWLDEVPPPSDWVHYEVISQAGVTRHYRNHKLDMTTTGAQSVSQIRIGHYWALDGVADCPSNPGADVYTDNVYIDTSIARVVLANAKTFDGATKRQVQRVTVWSNGIITIIPNTWQFAPGESAYLLVMSANNSQPHYQEVTVR